MKKEIRQEVIGWTIVLVIMQSNENTLYIPSKR